MSPATPQTPGTRKQRYRVSERGRAENRERMRRRRARLQACGTKAGDMLRRRIAWLGWAVCADCYGVHPACAIEIDHKVPVIDGGCDSASNVQALCIPCHRAKTAQEALWR